MANKLSNIKKLKISHLGRLSHDDAMMQMYEVHEQVLRGRSDGELLIVEHEPVITKGRRLKDHVIAFHEEISKRQVVIRDVDRGGLLTFHGPGQIIVYFVLRVHDYFQGVRELVSYLEEVLIAVLADHNIVAHKHSEFPGVWVGDHKLASIGLRVTAGVTTHGISLNVNNDLSIYNYFEPCGLSGEVMTNMETVLGNSLSRDMYDALAQQLGQKFAQGLQEKHARKYL
jgi:lipoate-protein ligase B